MESTPTPIIDIMDLALVSPVMSRHCEAHRLAVAHGDVIAVFSDAPADGRHLLRILATLEQPRRGNAVSMGKGWI
jgi:ABC-type Na+ transport system ATPase subunit NatA